MNIINGETQYANSNKHRQKYFWKRDYESKCQKILDHILSRFSSQITRLEIHFSDENSATKSGVIDK